MAYAVVPAKESLGMYNAWPWQWYALTINGRWISSKSKLTSIAATEWRLDTMEKNWNSTVRLLRYDNSLKKWVYV